MYFFGVFSLKHTLPWAATFMTWFFFFFLLSWIHALVKLQARVNDLLGQQSPHLLRKRRTAKVPGFITRKQTRCCRSETLIVQVVRLPLISSPANRRRNDCITHSSWPWVWNLAVCVCVWKPAANNLLIIYRGEKQSGISLSQPNEFPSSFLLLLILRL